MHFHAHAVLGPLQFIVKHEIIREKGRDLTQSYDKDRNTNRNVK